MAEAATGSRIDFGGAIAPPPDGQVTISAADPAIPEIEEALRFLRQGQPKAALRWLYDAQCTIELTHNIYPETE